MDAADVDPHVLERLEEQLGVGAVVLHEQYLDRASPRDDLGYAMLEFLSKLLSADFMPHGHCYFWQPEVLWLNVGSDVGIGLAYFTIPLALLVFVRRRRDLAFKQVFVLFSAFILACGTTHLFDVVTVWTPMYRLEGVLKLVTAMVSVATAIVLWRLLPTALRLPSPAQLEAANAELSAEVARREEAEQRLLESNEALEARVAERTEALARSNRDLQQFAYVASHDLQEPLRMVSSYVGLLDKRYGHTFDERGERYVGHALDGAQRMRRMIEDLLELSRAGEGLGPAESVDVDRCLDEAIEGLGEAIRDRDAEILRPAPLPAVRAHATRVTRLLTNLLSNAIKYSEERPRITVSAARDGDRWRISVRDEGMGIDPEHHAVIWDVFRRLHTHDEIVGSGIGLSICRRIVEGWDGTIELESAPGEGSTFTFTVPAA